MKKRFTKRQIDEIIREIEWNSVSGVPNPTNELDKISLQDLRLVFEAMELEEL